MTSEEENQIIAVWLGWKNVGHRWHSPACQRDEAHCTGKLPDFDNDLAAIEMALDKFMYDAPLLFVKNLFDGIAGDRKTSSARRLAIKKALLEYLKEENQ